MERSHALAQVYVGFSGHSRYDIFPETSLSRLGRDRLVSLRRDAHEKTNREFPSTRGQQLDAVRDRGVAQLLEAELRGKKSPRSGEFHGHESMNRTSEPKVTRSRPSRAHSARVMLRVSAPWSATASPRSSFVPILREKNVQRRSAKSQKRGKHTNLEESPISLLEANSPRLRTQRHSTHTDKRMRLPKENIRAQRERERERDVGGFTQTRL